MRRRRPSRTGTGYSDGLALEHVLWIDPESELVGMVWTQLKPFGAYEIEREFQTLVYDSLQ